jgi:hypothetical protein
MYDYLAKIVLLGPSGAGKYVSRRGGEGGRVALTRVCRSCVLHRFVRDECTSTIPREVP